jgi:hypothetical protein
LSFVSHPLRASLARKAISVDAGPRHIFSTRKISILTTTSRVENVQKKRFRCVIRCRRHSPSSTFTHIASRYTHKKANSFAPPPVNVFKYLNNAREQRPRVFFLSRGSLVAIDKWNLRSDRHHAKASNIEKAFPARVGPRSALQFAFNAHEPNIKMHIH